MCDQFVSRDLHALSEHHLDELLCVSASAFPWRFSATTSSQTCLASLNEPVLFQSVHTGEGFVQLAVSYELSVAPTQRLFSLPSIEERVIPKFLPQGQGPDAMRPISPMSNRTRGNHLFPKVVTKIRPMPAASRAVGEGGEVHAAEPGILVEPAVFALHEHVPGLCGAVGAGDRRAEYPADGPQLQCGRKLVGEGDEGRLVNGCSRPPGEPGQACDERWVGFEDSRLVISEFIQIPSFVALRPFRRGPNSLRKRNLPSMRRSRSMGPSSDRGPTDNALARMASRCVPVATAAATEFSFHEALSEASHHC